jgi:hypothetical protein
VNQWIIKESLFQVMLFIVIDLDKNKIQYVKSYKGDNAFTKISNLIREHK